MLVSHRRHAPLGPPSRLCIELDRVLAPSWIARRVRLSGAVQDEHMTTQLGKGTQAERARLKIVLVGRLEATVGGRTFELRAGDFLVMPRIAECLTCGGDDETLELDWDPEAPIAGAAVTTLEHGTLRPRALKAAKSIARALHDDVDPSSCGVLDALSRDLPAALRVLASDGLPLDPAGAEHELPPRAPHELRRGASRGDQRLFDAIDATLANLDDGPAVVGLEEKLGWSRRTVSRRTSELHQRYGLSGIDGESWRTVRDFYRLLVGTILASNPDVTTRGLAVILGYASPDALCHAFANAGLPSPGAIRKLPRVA
ncbi:hypothetical protein BH11MYX4_BH11MYX4_69660 [soil metagenome]